MGRYSFPAKFMLVCAMNPCKCGYYGHKSMRCTCSPESVHKYLSKISGPLLDRIDIHIEVPSIEFEELNSKATNESSADIRERVLKAREIMSKRYKDEQVRIQCNSQLSSAQIRKYCKLDSDAENILKLAFERMGLSARGYDRILRVARTIADLSSRENITAEHISEAIQYRTLDRKFRA
jgi:magnesium chelatase family protein